jgi:hypothetical protein
MVVSERLEEKIYRHSPTRSDIESTQRKERATYPLSSLDA